MTEDEENDEETARTNLTTDPEDPSRYDERLKNEVARVRGTKQGFDGVERSEDEKDLRLFAKESDIESSTLENYVGRMRRLTKVLNKPLRECDEDDIKLAIDDYAEQHSRVDEYKDSTKAEYLKSARAFGESREVSELESITTPNVGLNTINLDFVLNHEEVIQLIESADSTRNTAMIAVNWECAWRRTALQSLKLKHFDEQKSRNPSQEYGLLQTPSDTVEGLKGAENSKKPVTFSKGYLDNWLREHPESDNPESALFCRLDKSKHYGEHLSKNAVKKIYDKVADKAGIDKERVYPHMMRHSRCTYMKKQEKYNDTMIERVMDWKEGTSEHRRYAHVEQDEKVGMILEAQGIESEEIDIEDDETKCPRCERIIPNLAETCPYCSLALEQKQPRWFRHFEAVTEESELVQYYQNRPVPEFEELPPNAHKKVGKTLIIASNAVSFGADADHVQEDQTDILRPELAEEELTEEDADWILMELINPEATQEHRELYREDYLISS